MHRKNCIPRHPPCPGWSFAFIPQPLDNARPVFVLEMVIRLIIRRNLPLADDVLYLDPSVDVPATQIVGIQFINPESLLRLLRTMTIDIGFRENRSNDLLIILKIGPRHRLRRTNATGPSCQNYRLQSTAKPLITPPTSMKCAFTPSNALPPRQIPPRLRAGT